MDESTNTPAQPEHSKLIKPVVRHVEHGGAVTRAEAQQFMAKCYCGWTTFKMSQGEADYELNSHITSALVRDKGGKKL